MNEPLLPEISDEEREAAKCAAIMRSEFRQIGDNRQNVMKRDDWNMLPPEYDLDTKKD